MLTESAFEELRKKPLSKMTGTELKALADNWSEYVKPNDNESPGYSDGIFDYDTKTIPIPTEIESDPHWIQVGKDGYKGTYMITASNGKSYREAMPFDSEEYLSAEHLDRIVADSEAVRKTAWTRFVETNAECTRVLEWNNYSLRSQRARDLDKKRTRSLQALQNADWSAVAYRQLKRAIEDNDIKRAVYWQSIAAWHDACLSFRWHSKHVRQRKESAPKGGHPGEPKDKELRDTIITALHKAMRDRGYNEPYNWNDPAFLEDANAVLREVKGKARFTKHRKAVNTAFESLKPEAVRS